MVSPHPVSFNVCSKKERDPMEDSSGNTTALLPLTLSTIVLLFMAFATRLKTKTLTLYPDEPDKGYVPRP